MCKFYCNLNNISNIVPTRMNLRGLASFAIFDLPLNVGYNKLLLHNIHEQNIKDIPYWNLEGAGGKLIAYYWYLQVLYHFLALFRVAFIIMLPFAKSQFIYQYFDKIRQLKHLILCQNIDKRIVEIK